MADKSDDRPTPQPQQEPPPPFDPDQDLIGYEKRGNENDNGERR